MKIFGIRDISYKLKSIRLTCLDVHHSVPFSGAIFKEAQYKVEDLPFLTTDRGTRPCSRFSMRLQIRTDFFLFASIFSDKGAYRLSGSLSK